MKKIHAALLFGFVGLSLCSCTAGSIGASEDDSKSEGTSISLDEVECNEWGFDSFSHWRCSGKGDGVRKEESPHTLKDEACSVCGLDFSDKLIYAINEEGTAYCVTGIKEGSGDKVAIPSVHEGLPVTELSLSFDSFPLDKELSLVIPKSILSILAEWGANLKAVFVDSDNPVYDSRNDCNAVIEKANNTLVRGSSGTKIPKEVASVGPYAFRGTASFHKIVLPEGVTSIGFGAFGNCANLEEVSLPSTLVSIGDFSFCQDYSLRSISFPSNLTYIGACAFQYCTSLESLYIPSKVASIDARSFADCSSLTSIEVDDANGSYDSRNNCNAIIDTEKSALVSGCLNTVIPEGVKSIGPFAFAGATFKTFTIPSGVEKIEGYAFDQCESLVSISLPDTLLSIGSCAFGRCSSLASISIPKSVESLASGAFSECPALKSIHVDSDGALKNLQSDSIESLTIGKNVREIPQGCFRYLPSLTSVVVDENNPVFDSRDNCNAVIETASNALIAGCASTVIPSTVTSIGSQAFAGCESLTSIVIPESVTSIGWWAFDDCPIATLTINNDSAAEDIYGHCSVTWRSLVSLVLGEAVTKVALSDSSFPALKNLFLTNTSTEIQTYGGLKVSDLNVYYYSEVIPSEEGDYWHYVGDVPTVW